MMTRIGACDGTTDRGLALVLAFAWQGSGGAGPERGAEPVFPDQRWGAAALSRGWTAARPHHRARAGWTMPAWIWGPQISAFSRATTSSLSTRAARASPRWRFPATSRAAAARTSPSCRAPAPGPVLLVGWSLGVLDTLAYIRTHGDTRVAGLVLVDNSVGEEPAAAPAAPRRAPLLPRRVDAPVRPQHVPQAAEPSLSGRADRRTLRTPQYASAALLSYPVPRSYWRDTIYSTAKPVLYAVRPAFAGQAMNLDAQPAGDRDRRLRRCRARPVRGRARPVQRAGAGFIRRRVWP